MDCSVASARRACSSQRSHCCATTPRHRKGRSAPRLAATCAVALATRTLSKPCGWQRSAPVAGFSPTRRNEDPRLLVGMGSFVDDIDPTGVLHAALLRSPYGHARIRSIDVSAARAHQGVQGVYTATDLGSFNQPAPLVVPHPNLSHG